MKAWEGYLALALLLGIRAHQLMHDDPQTTLNVFVLVLMIAVQAVFFYRAWKDSAAASAQDGKKEERTP